MSLQVKNLSRLDGKTRKEIQARADAIRANGGVPPESGSAAGTKAGSARQAQAELPGL
jgi:hypothetical protein